MKEFDQMEEQQENVDFNQLIVRKICLFKDNKYTRKSANET